MPPQPGRDYVVRPDCCGDPVNALTATAFWGENWEGREC